MPYSIRIIRELEELDPKLRGVFLSVLEEIEKNVKETVKKSDFDELKQIVAQLGEKVGELAEAQKRTEERVNELAEAQKKSEERLTKLEITVNELAEAQKKSEERLTKLEITVNELAEAQKRTEERVNELAEAQKNTEKSVDKLTEALERLTRSHYELRQEVGVLAHTVGYRLEDEAFKALPDLLRKDLGIEIKGGLKRDFIEIAPNKYMEVNIFGYGQSNGKDYLIIGEAKSQLKKKDVDLFIKKAASVTKYIPKEQIRLLVTYIASPQVQRYVRENNINLYFSYDF